MSWNTAWQLFVGIVAVGFAALETTSLVVPADGQTKRNTLSAKIRYWMGIEPKAPRRWWTRIVFLAFLTWFEIHILTPYL